ncbi:MAG: type II toxin-antitoxin system RelE/ParE family toxin [Opitutaceae bacterium]
MRFYPSLAYSSQCMEFVRFFSFEKSAAALFTEADILELELQLLLDPEAGEVIPSTKGLRKLRRPLAGRGKRGGARVIYYLVTAHKKILLLYAYAKNVQGNLTAAQAKQLVILVQQEFP